jgi:hypothetical protein
MNKLEIYTELFARFLILLIALPFAVVFLVFYALGFIAEFFFTWTAGFNDRTKQLLAKTAKT